MAILGWIVRGTSDAQDTIIEEVYTEDLVREWRILLNRNVMDVTVEVVECQ